MLGKVEKDDGTMYGNRLLLINKKLMLKKFEANMIGRLKQTKFKEFMIK